MAEKVASMRLGEEDLEHFRVFAKENGMNHQQAFKSLVALVELEKARTTSPERAKEIDVFRDTVNKLIGFYSNSLEINKTTEETIREELKKELATKDTVIANLQDQLKDIKEDNDNLNDKYKKIESDNKDLQQKIIDLNSEFEEKNSIINLIKRNNDNLQDQVIEYKKKNKKLEKKLEEANELNKQYWKSIGVEITEK